MEWVIFTTDDGETAIPRDHISSVRLRHWQTKKYDPDFDQEGWDVVVNGGLVTLRYGVDKDRAVKMYEDILESLASEEKIGRVFDG